jgi:hypothetical protein
MADEKRRRRPGCPAFVNGLAAFRRHPVGGKAGRPGGLGPAGPGQRSANLPGRPRHRGGGLPARFRGQPVRRRAGAGGRERRDPACPDPRAPARRLPPLVPVGRSTRLSGRRPSQERGGGKGESDRAGRALAAGVHHAHGRRRSGPDHLGPRRRAAVRLASRRGCHRLRNPGRAARSGGGEKRGGLFRSGEQRLPGPGANPAVAPLAGPGRRR